MSGEYSKTRACITLLIYCIIKDFSVNRPKLIFDNMIADNFEHRNLPYGIILTIFFDFWGVDLSKKPFISPHRAFDRSFLKCMLSHISKSAQDVSSDEEEDISILEPQHTSPLVPPTDPYSTLLASVIHLTLSHNQLRDDFCSTAATLHSHKDLLSSISLRFNITWAMRFHLHLNTFIPFLLLTLHFHHMTRGLLLLLTVHLKRYRSC